MVPGHFLQYFRWVPEYFCHFVCIIRGTLIQDKVINKQIVLLSCLSIVKSWLWSYTIFLPKVVFFPLAYDKIMNGECVWIHVILYSLGFFRAEEVSHLHSINAIFKSDCQEFNSFLDTQNGMWFSKIQSLLSFICKK